MNMWRKIIDIILVHYAVDKIFVYGSYARGTQTDESDIDICIQMPEETKVNRHDFALNKVLTDAIGKEVHCVFCTMDNGWCEKLIYDIKTGIHEPV